MVFVSGQVNGQSTEFYNWYSGLGNLLGTDWGNPLDATRLTEVYTVDAMGNQARSTSWRDGNGTPPTSRNVYQSGTGRITSIGRVLSAQPGETALPDSTYRHYDAAGNVTWGEYKGWGSYTNGSVGINHLTLTRNYYGADAKLRVVQVHDETTTGSTWTQNGSYAEYRYDPLGRRIMERTRRDSVCFNTSHDCGSTLTRFVWAGDQLLWELRVPGGNDVTTGASGLDATSASGAMYGRVSYFHAGGIDKPLLITKEGAESVVPRDTWRGQFHAGTSPTTGLVRDCQQGGQTGCLLIAWPGWRTTATHAWGDTIAPDIDVWYGGLVDGMRDASGQMYMRNRYYDPATGQFTQTDPIGLAGGLNAHGFAAGDPVSSWDPFGLACEKKSEDRLVCTNVGPGDYRTVRDFLGGEAGQRAFSSFDGAGLTQWDSRTCQGGFTSAQCDRIADAQSSLTLHSNAFCAALGVRSTKRFQSGRFGWRPNAGQQYFGMSTPFNPFGMFRITRLSPLAFNPGELANTIAHEEFHYERPFAGEPRANSTGYACAGPI